MNRLRHADEIKRARLMKRCGGGGRASRRRSWNGMNHEILVSIMLRLRWREWAFTVCYISKSWLSALLDALFPAGNQQLDLHQLLSIQGVYFRRRFRHYINLVLDRRTQPVWTKLILPNNHKHFGEQFYHFLCQRLRSLRVLIVPKPQKIYVWPLPKLVPYWKNLREVHTRSTMVLDLSVHCKYIYHLGLYGLIENLPASRIATAFPLLKCLVLQSATLTMNALSVILDGHKNLELLDTRHCHRITDEEIPTKSRWMFSMVFRPTEWNEEEILDKASGVKIHLQCARQHCPECCHLYIISSN